MKIELYIKNGKKIPLNYRTKWKSIYYAVKNDTDKNLLIFLCEILEIFDNGNNCYFTSKNYEAHDSIGVCNYDWILHTQNLKIHKKLTWEESENWQRFKVKEDLLEFSGFNKDFAFEWNGNTNDYTGIEMFFTGIDADKLQKIKKIAVSLYQKVLVTQMKFVKEVTNDKFEAPKYLSLNKNFTTFVFNNWEFYLTRNEKNQKFLSIPDSGGMADSNPKSEDQYNWCINNFENIENLVQIWNTSWELTNDDIIIKIRKLFNLPELDI